MTERAGSYGTLFGDLSIFLRHDIGIKDNSGPLWSVELKRNLIKTKVIFQVIYAIYILGLYRLVHHDLHFANILVVKLFEPRKMYFKVREQGFVIETEYIPFLFDWDWAYCELLGDNPLLANPTYCHVLGMCNEFNPRFDMYLLMCFLMSGNYTTYFKNFALGTPYGNKIYKYQEPKIHNKFYLNLTPEEYKSITSFNPSFVYYKAQIKKKISIYRMGQWQLFNIVPSLFDRYPILSKIAFIKLGLINDDNYKAIIFSDFTCRPGNLSIDLPDPRDILLGNYNSPDPENYSKIDIFWRLRTDLTPEEENVEQKYVFIDPFNEIVSSRALKLDLTKSTRNLIKGEPVLPKPQSKKVFVHTKDDWFSDNYLSKTPDVSSREIIFTKNNLGYS